MTSVRARRGPPSFLLALVLAGLGCGTGGSPGPTKPSAPAASAMDLAGLVQVLDSTWYAEVPRDPAALNTLVEGPAGEGWLKLFSGDLDSAVTSFAAGGEDPAAQLGLARVALARADALRSAFTLEQTLVPQLVAYRRERSGRIREGRYEPVLAALSLQGYGASVESVEAAVERARGWSPPEGGDQKLAEALLGLLESRVAGTARPNGLPVAFEARLEDADRIAAGQTGQMTAATAQPDVIDSLGADSEAGLEFQLKWWDPVAQRSLFRAQLVLIQVHASAAGPAGLELVAVAREAWGDEEPVELSPPRKGTEGPSEAMAFFGSPWADAADLRAAWGLPGGLALLDRVAAAVPQEELTQGTAPADVDRMLRFEARFEPAVRSVLEARATNDEGKALVGDLQLSRKVADQLLRQRMLVMAEAGEPVTALRLGERSLDVASPTAGDATRISHRNDAGFLIRLGGVHAASRRHGVAREYIHPLTARLPSLTSLTYTLGQLDAASSIGVQGKTSQQ